MSPRIWRRARHVDVGRDWYATRESKLVLESDLAPAEWIEPLLSEEDRPQVREMAPQGFGAYAQIFFPFAGRDIVRDGKVIGQEHITWTEMIRRNGRIAHVQPGDPLIQEPGGKRVRGYDELADEQFEALLPILARHTASPRSWFLLWDGFGDLDQQAFRALPTVRHSIRDFYLLSGPHGAYEHLPHDPNYWWPDDRAWCLCTDVDLNDAYLAGSVACIDEVLTVPVLDAYLTKPENPAMPEWM